MRIAFALFPISKIGGITTHQKNVVWGLKELGHEVDEYFISTNTKILGEPKIVRDLNLKVLGFRKPEWLRDCMYTLNEYDLVIFSHPCPHQIKSYTDRTWMEIFKRLTTNFLVINHDMYIDKFYGWFAEIIKRQPIKMVCVQTKTYISMKNYSCMKRTIPFPIRFPDDGGLYDDKKENVVVDHANFKTCKHKDKTLEIAQLDKTKVIFYGDGIGMYELKKSPLWSKVENNGFQPISKIREDLKRAKIIADFSYFGSPNIPNMDYTMLEGACYGAVPLTQIPTPTEFGVESVVIGNKSPEQVAKHILDNFKDYDDLRKRNIDAIKRMLNPIVIAQDIINFSKAPYIKPKIGLARWS